MPFTSIAVRGNQGIVQPGDEVRHAYLVADGLLGRFEETAAGDWQITALHLPGDMANLHSAVVPQATSGLAALCGSTVFTVPLTALSHLIEGYPAIGMALWRDSVVDASILSAWLSRIGSRSAISRLAHLLCEMAVRLTWATGGTRLRFDFPVTQHQLGECTGMTSVHLNRKLMELRDRGFLRMRAPTVEIKDWNGLVRLAEFDPGYLHLPTAAIDRVLGRGRHESARQSGCAAA